MNKIRVCPKCGHEEGIYTFFCTKCGAKTKEKEANATQQNKLKLSNQKLDLQIEVDSEIMHNTHFEYMNSEQNYISEDLNKDKRDTIHTIKTDKLQISKKTAVFCTAAAFLLIISVIFLLMFRGNSNNYPNNNSNKDNFYYLDKEENSYKDNMNKKTPIIRESSTAYEMTSDKNIPETKKNIEKKQSEYILFESNSKYLEMGDLNGLTKEECRLARNELFARHGRKFNDETLQAYFNAKSWYKGTINPNDFDETVFNEYEKANMDLIVQYETKQGYR